LSVDRHVNLIDNHYQQDDKVLVRNKLICFSTLKHVWPTIKLRSPVANRNAPWYWQQVIALLFYLLHCSYRWR